MTETARTYSNEDLTAFLDGEASDELTRALVADLARDPGLAERVEALDFPKALLRDAFAADLDSAPAFPTLPSAQPSAAPEDASAQSPHAALFGWKSGFLGLGTGLAAGLVLAIGLDLQAPTEPAAPTPAAVGWRDAVAIYQMLYTPSTLASVESPDQSQLTTLSDAISLDLSPFAEVEGLNFERAQELGFNGKTLIQIAYSLPDGTPFAICILKSDAPAADTRFAPLRGLQSADWTTGTHGILLIGGTDSARLQALAPQIKALL